MKAGVIGASGYTGVELLRLAAAHPNLDVVVATANTQAGRPVAEHTPSLAAAYPGLHYETAQAEALDGLDVVFCALPHGESQKIVPELVGRVGAVVDLAADFRLTDPSAYPTWYGEPHRAPALLDRFVYGLPELFRDAVTGSDLVAAPGCYPTAAALALVPLLRAGLIADIGIVVDAASGVSGAGRAPTEALHFGAVDEDFRAYGLLDHRHTPEMEQATGAQILFTPHLAPMVRGILATAYARPAGSDHSPSTADVLDALGTFYADEPFVVVGPEPPSTKATAGSNCAHLTARVDQRTGWVLVLCALDNLIKGASGQAVQCANLMLGRPETEGLPGPASTRDGPDVGGDGLGVTVGVTVPGGFVAVGGSAGIKAAGVPDVAVVATSDGRAVPTAAVFTANLAAAAPVRVSRDHLAAAGGRSAAVVLTSGNANAATGVPGVDHATTLCRLVAEGIGAETSEVLVCQTGLIGIPFPIETAAPALPGIVAARRGGEAAGAAAAVAIMTTDTVAKEVVVHGDGFCVGGMAKGAAMLAPDMATMLALLTTDARCDPATLATVLARAVGPSFNSMTVDGCTSTNDTVILMASGTAGRPSEAALGAAVTEACSSLAAQMVADAEGATKVVHLTVTGAVSDAEAHAAARKVGDSLLVKCSLNGEDPYWGRVVSELGTAGVTFDMDTVTIAYGGTAVCVGGVAAAHDAGAVAAHLAGRHVSIECDLGLGSGSAVVLSTDLGYGYLDENRTTS